nr:putative membrane protein [Quercus suber]
MGAAPEEASRAVAASGLPAATAEKELKINGVRIAEKEWNLKNIGSRLGVDVISAATAGGLVAPVITVIDKAIIENASGRQPMMASIRTSLQTLLLSPHRFIGSRPFALIFALYTGTYLTANALDTVKSATCNKSASSTTSGPAKFIATSGANLSLCLYKDSQFTRMFGAVSARPVPGPSYALFATRDCMTIFASFNLPAIIAPSLPMTDEAEKYVSRISAAQFLAPAAIQLVSTPLHLLGLDLYNRNGGTPFSDRLRKVRIDWLPSSLARMGRIVPAFGVGGVVNTGMRKTFMTGLE